MKTTKWTALTAVLAASAGLALATGGTALAVPAARTPPQASGQAAARPPIPPPWTISPGGAFSGTLATSWVLADTSSGASITCTTSSLSGTLLSGTVSGPVVGSIGSVSLGGCTALGITFTVTAVPGNLPWTLSALTLTGTAPGVMQGRLTGVALTLSAPGCSAVVNGTSATAMNGKVPVSYTNNTSKLQLHPVGNLHVYSVTGCFGLISTGDAATITAKYAFTPLQTIN
jgi:hypothetical protein